LKVKDSVVSTGAERSEAKRRDLLSALGRQLVESRSLHSALRAPVETTGSAFKHRSLWLICLEVIPV
jgi:hypothetical protein